MSEPMQPPRLPGDASADPGGSLLSAWLDGQAPAAEKAPFECRMDREVELRLQAGEFRGADTLLRGWYAGLSAMEVEEKPVPRKESMRMLPYAALAGVAAAIVLLLVPVLWKNSTQGLAEEAVEKTARALDAAAGLLAEFSVTTLRRLPAPDAQGGKEEKHTATGEIRFGRLSASRLLFDCQMRWAATADEPELLRRWGQSSTGQWLYEKQGRSVITQSVTHAFNPDDLAGNAAFSQDRADGSPVDIRTRQAVEGLAVLLRSFHRDRFRKWMGCEWTSQGGKGSQVEPWAFSTEPFGASQGQHPKLVWSLRLWAGKDGVLEGLALEETITEAKSGEQLSLLRTTYALKPRSEPWPIGTFELESRKRMAPADEPKGP